MRFASTHARRASGWQKKDGLAIAVVVFLAVNIFVVVHYGFGGVVPTPAISHHLR